MFIYTAKVQKSKLILIALLVACLLALVVLVAANRSAEDQAVMETQQQSLSAETNEARIAYLASFGWTVEETPVETQEVKIPKEFPELLEKYNTLQKNQGFDLHEYEGKRIKQYVYTVTNYPGAQEPVLATLLVYKDKIIGGDIRSSAQDGFLHGFENPN